MVQFDPRNWQIAEVKKAGKTRAKIVQGNCVAPRAQDRQSLANSWVRIFHEDSFPHLDLEGPRGDAVVLQLQQ